MDEVRIYGRKPYSVVVVHGGPGAPGGVAPIAKELSKLFGVVETLHKADSIQGQLEELKEAIETNCKGAVILIGHSWGAWLSYIFAATYPKLVRKVILVGSGVFEEQYLKVLNDNRASRLTEEENQRMNELLKSLHSDNDEDKKSILSEFGKLMSKADSFSPISLEDEILDFQPKVFENCMNDINNLRKNGELLKLGHNIQCSVVAIHGEYDTHPFEGVKNPLIRVIRDFKFILLKDCGHYPWNETYGKNLFYKILYTELSGVKTSYH
jgi:pimeloyl-ACP methyl ester carboxylesterase